MNPAPENHPIRPELVARKLESVRNFEHEDVLAEITDEPRLVELLWFLQWISSEWISSGENYAGGLRKFARELIADSADLIGTATMPEEEYLWSIEMRHAIRHELPNSVQRDLGIRDIKTACINLLPGDECDRDFDEEERERARVDAARARLERLARTDVLVCAEAAGDELAGYLQTLCEGTAIRFRREKGRRHCGYEDMEAPWYLARVAAAFQPADQQTKGLRAHRDVATRGRRLDSKPRQS